MIVSAGSALRTGRPIHAATVSCPFALRYFTVSKQFTAHFSSTTPLSGGMEKTFRGSGSEGKKSRSIAEAKPSSSVLLISPTNQILLLHRVQSSSSFAAAHVFPGGNVDPFHDGEVPPETDTSRHEDSRAYRLAAIRETFEESGILLAKDNEFGRLVEVAEKERDEGRKRVHGRNIAFETWVGAQGGLPDVDSLIPFTRWITPTQIPKRYSTQMYIYFLPLQSESSQKMLGPDNNSDSRTSLSSGGGLSGTLIPTPDGGVEHTAAKFAYAADWLAQADRGEIILYPPQYFLLSLVANCLYETRTVNDTVRAREIRSQRSFLRTFVKQGDPQWGEKVISPIQGKVGSDGMVVLSLDNPGHELKGTNRRGEKDRVVVAQFERAGPRQIQVRWRRDVMGNDKDSKL